MLSHVVPQSQKIITYVDCERKKNYLWLHKYPKACSDGYSGLALHGCV